MINILKTTISKEIWKKVIMINGINNHIKRQMTKNKEIYNNNNNNNNVDLYGAQNPPLTRRSRRITNKS